MNEEQIIAAVDHLNEQLHTLPDATPCSLEGLYPDFDYPECCPEVYLTLVEEEIESVEEKLRQHEGSQDDSLQRLLVMLQECASALWRTGVGSVFGEGQRETSYSCLDSEADTDNDLSEPPLANNDYDQSE